MLANLLLPDASLRLDTIEVSGPTVIVSVTATRAEVACTVCACPSRRIHSSYRRTLADVPLSGRCVRLQLRVRRFFCLNPRCHRKTFTERLPDFAPPSARRTRRLAEMQRVLGLVLGGEAGARVVRQLAIPTSPDTLLRLIRREPAPEGPTPRVLGIDDWAWKKGCVYGTILVDLERRCPVDLLPDRTAETLTVWLQQHPGVQIVSRDRAGAYADGVARGAADAVQVADRWHLLTNMRETIQRLLDRHHQHLPAIRLAEASAAQGESRSAGGGSDLAAGAMAKRGCAQRKLSSTERIRQERHSRRFDRFTKVVALRQQGVSIRAIAAQVHLDRRTVRRYVAADAFPEIAKRRPRPSILDPWKPYLQQRWEEGCHNGAQLWRDLQTQGYRGSRSVLSTWVSQRRKTTRPSSPPTRGCTEQPTSPTRIPGTERRLSAKQAAWLLVRQPHRLGIEEQEALTKLRLAEPELEQAYVLAQSFGQLVRERRCQELDSWIESAKATRTRELRSFAAGLVRDKDAVFAALSLPWSNGQVEGQVHRLKLIKRQMYGRAKFDLLRVRVLACSGP